MQAYYSQMQVLIQSSVDSETSDYSFLTSNSDFQTAIDDLMNHVDERYTVAFTYAN